MPGSCQTWALHPKLMKRISGFTSCVIVIPRRFLIELSVILLARTTIVASTVAISGNYLYQLNFLRDLFINSAGFNWYTP
jgi:hypothetical protein